MNFNQLFFIKFLSCLIIIIVNPILAKVTTKAPNIIHSSSTNQRIKRPMTNHQSISETHHNRNITNPRVIERIIGSTTTVANLSKIITTKAAATATTTTTTTAKLKSTEVGKNSSVEKVKNSGNSIRNITQTQPIPNLNNTDAFRENQLNEKNSTTNVNSTISPAISQDANLPIIPDLNTYFDPVLPDSNDEITDPVNEVANLTEGFDSFLINENINAFTTGTTLCPKCKCGVKTLKKIVGGDITARNEYPWIVLLTYNQQFFCAGSLINNLYIVTAAHCTTTFQKDKILIHLQDINKNSENTFEIITRKISNVYRPLHFNQNTFFNDISLMKLSEPVDISGGLIRPICLPIDKTSFVGKVGTITGWRINNQRNLQLARLVNTTVLSNRQCRKTLVGKLITPTMICSSATRPNQGSECRGDSGGPLMVTQKGRSRLAGVVSWGLGCTKKNAADVFTRTTKFNGWLRKLSTEACWCN